MVWPSGDCHWPVGGWRLGFRPSSRSPRLGRLWRPGIPGTPAISCPASCPRRIASPSPGTRCCCCPAAYARSPVPGTSLDHVPYRDVDRGARRVLVGVLVLLNPVRAQPFAGPVRAGPDPPALLAEAVGVSFHPQPVFHCLQAVGAHILAELEAPGHAAFALGVAVAVVLPPHQPTQ